MSFMPAVATLATAGTEKLRELPMPPWAFGAIAFATFLLLLGVLWSFRNTAARYDAPVMVDHCDSDDSHDSHWRTDPGAHL